MNRLGGDEVDLVGLTMITQSQRPIIRNLRLETDIGLVVDLGDEVVVEGEFAV